VCVELAKEQRQLSWELAGNGSARARGLVSNAAVWRRCGISRLGILAANFRFLGNEGSTQPPFPRQLKPLATMASVAVQRLTYAHNSYSETALTDIALDLPPGSRTLLVGANGGEHNACPRTVA